MTAHAGGMVLPVRGVRSLARGGAFVAGADDADALWLNPAGLAHLRGNNKRALMFDAAFVYQTVDYTRIDSDGDPLPTVTNQQPGQPIPTLAGALGIGDRLVIAGGLASPYGGLHRYGGDGPQRYASVSLDGSRFVVVTVGVAYAVTDRLRVGATLQNMVSQITSRVVVSACPGAMTCASEDPSFDAAVELEQNDYVSPSGSIGVQYDAADSLTLGLAMQAPARVSGSGTLTLELPSSVVFDAATVTGDGGRLAFTLPATIRAGVEWRPDERWRIEAALDAELWSMHDDITLEPIDVTVENVAGASLAVKPMVIPREYATSFSPSLGAEWHGPNVMFGAGYSYETAAAPASHVSVLTVDAAKHVVGIGGGYEAEGWQIGAAAGLVALSSVDVPLATGKVTQLAPLADEPSTAVVNAGSYKSRYVVAGLRFARRW